MNSRKRSFGGSMVILILLIYILGTMMVHIPAWAQEPEVVLYQEDFGDGQAQGWELEPGWRVIQDGDNGVLAGEGHQWARPGVSYGSDFRVQFRLKLLAGRIHLVYRFNETGRYFIGFHEGGSDLNKQYWPDTFIDGLASSTTPHTLGGWHQVEIVGQGASLRFLVDGQLEWEYTDSDPLLGGSFAFETLDDSVAYVDDILVYGPAPTPTPTPDVRFTWVRIGGPLGGLGYDVRMRPDNPDVMYVTDAWAGVFISTDGGQTWFPSNEGITTRAGESGDAIPVFCLTIDPHDHDIIWVGTQNVRGIFKSTDGGRTWVEMDNGVVEYQGITFRGFTVDPRSSDIVYAAAELSSWAWAGEGRSGREFDMTQGVVYKTTDGGQNWTTIWRGDNLARYVWIDPRDPEVVYVSTGIFDREAANSIPDSRTPGGVGMIKSTDGGQTWREVNKGLANLYVGTLFMHPENPDILLAGTGNNQYYDGAGAYLSTDGGGSWQQTLAGENINSVEFALSQPDIAYAGSADAVYRSQDGGYTWQRVSGGRDGWGPPGVRAGFPIDFQVDPRDPDRIFANNYGGGNFLSTDGGRTWMVASKGYTGAQVRDIAADPTAAGRVFAAARSGLFVSTDGGDDWVGLNTPPAASLEWYVVAIDPMDPQHVLAANNWNGVLLQSHDRGRTWRPVSQRPDESMSWRAIAFAPSEPATVYAGTSAFFSAGTFDDRMSAGGIYVSHDGGATWTPANDALSQEANVTSLAVDPHDLQVVYAATGNHGLLKTTDGGQSWIAIHQGLPGSPWALSVALHPADARIVYAGLGMAGLYRSEDGGATWQPSAAGLNPEASVSDIVFDPTDPQVMYAADRFSGVYRSTDGVATWMPINTGLRTRAVNALSISSDGQHLYAATEGEGVFRLDLSGQPPQPASLPTPVPPTSTLTPRPTLAPTSAPPVLSPVEGSSPTAAAAVPTATPQLAAFPPKPTPEPQAKRGICPAVAVLSLALVGLVLYRPVLPIVIALVLIGLPGCAVITGREAPTPEQLVPVEEQPPESPLEAQPPGEGPPVEVQITLIADRTNLQSGQCATLQWNVQGGFGVELNGQPVERSGRTQVCPDETTTYWLAVDTGETIERRKVVVSLAGAEEPPPQGPPSDESKHALARQFELPEGYVVERLFEPPLPEPTLARSQSGVIFVAHAGSKPGVSLLDPSSGQVTPILDLPERVGGIIVGGPGDTAFIGMAGEIWQVSPDGSHQVWGQRRDGGPWCYAPDGRLLGISNDWTRVLELLPDGSSREVAGGFVEINGLAAAADGTVFVADVKTGQVTMVSPDGARHVVARVAPDAIGIGLDPEGNLFMNHVATGFVRVDLDSGDLFPYEAEHSSCRAISTPAGFVFPEPGRVIFQDFPASQITWADLNTGQGGLLVSNQGANTPAADIGPDDALYVGVSGCGDLIPGQVARIGDDGTRQIVVHGLRGEVRDIAFAPDGGLYIVTSDPYQGEPVVYVPPEGGDPFEIPDTALRNITSLAVDPGSGHLLAGTELGGTSVLELTLDGLLAEYPLDLPKKTMQFTLDIAPDGTLYAHASEAERFSTGPVVERWLLRLDLEDGSTQIVAQLDLNGCCPLANLSTDSQGWVWWLLSPDFLLYRVTPDGQRTLFAQNLDWDPMAVAVDRQGDVYITMPHGIYRIYRKP